MKINIDVKTGEYYLLRLLPSPAGPCPGKTWKSTQTWSLGVAAAGRYLNGTVRTKTRLGFQATPSIIWHRHDNSSHRSGACCQPAEITLMVSSLCWSNAHGLRYYASCSLIIIGSFYIHISRQVDERRYWPNRSCDHWHCHKSWKRLRRSVCTVPSLQKTFKGCSFLRPPLWTSAWIPSVSWRCQSHVRSRLSRSCSNL